MILFDPSNTELGWIPLGCGVVMHLLCDTYVVFSLLYAPNAILVLVAQIGGNHIMAFEVGI